MTAEKRKAAENDISGYLATIESIEPDIHTIDVGAFYASVAISLKRIADALENKEKATQAMLKSQDDYFDHLKARDVAERKRPWWKRL